MESEHNVASFPVRLRTPPLALRNVVHGGRRTLAAISGVAFSLTMVLLQLGFLEAVSITAANNFDQADFDIVLISPRYEQFYAPGFFPLDRLKLARSLETVVAAAPLYATFNLWRCPAYPVDHPDSESTAEVDQSDVPRLKVEDPATVQVLDQAVAGKVTKIGSVVGKNQLTNIDPRALQDRRVVKVTIALDHSEPARGFVNMEVDVTIKAGEAAASPAVTGK